MKKLLVLLLALVGSLLVTPFVLAADPDDYTNRIPFTSTATGGDFDDFACVSVNPSALTSGGFIGADMLDAAAFSPALSELSLIRTDTTSTDTCWWIRVATASGLTDTDYLYLGGVDNLQGVTLLDASDTLTITDASVLGITVDLSFGVEGLSFPSIASATTTVLGHTSAYDFAVTGGNTLLGRVYQEGATQNLYLYPVSNVSEGIDTSGGCGGAGNHYTCVDDTQGAPDDLTTWVESNSGAPVDTDIYGLTVATIPADARITAATLYYRVSDSGAGTGTVDVALCYSSCSSISNVLSTTPPTSPSWSTASGAVTPPGGGGWTPSSLASLQLRLRHTLGSATAIYTTQTYLHITYVVPEVGATLSYGSLAVNTPIEATITADGVNAKLYVDGAEVASTAFSAAIATTTLDLLGTGPFSAQRILIQDTGTPVLDLDFEPVRLTTTQTGASGNSWTSLFTVTDVEGNADATWTMVSDRSGLTVTEQGLASLASLDVATVSTDLANMIGTLGTIATATTASDTFTGDDSLESIIAFTGLDESTGAGFFLLAFVLNLMLWTTLARFVPDAMAGAVSSTGMGIGMAVPAVLEWYGWLWVVVGLFLTFGAAGLAALNNKR